MGLEDEIHFMVHCPAYATLREHNPVFAGISAHASPMPYIFQWHNVKVVAKYIRQSMLLRTAIMADSQ
jgi:hypothetical protein